MRSIFKLTLFVLGLLLPATAAAVSLSIPDVEATSGSVITIPVNLENDAPVRGFQFNFYYPEGFEVQSISKTDRVAETASVPSMAHSGYYAVIAYNMSTNICVEQAGSGAVVNITLRVPNNAVGPYEMNLRNIMVSMSDGTKYILDDVSASITTPMPPTALCTSIALDNTSAVMNVGETMQLAATVLPADAANKTVAWTSSNASVATVSSNGIVTAVAAGSATITATTCDGSNLSAACNVTVNEEEVVTGDVYLDIPNIEATPGSVVTIPVNLQNYMSVRGFQFNFYYPEGFEVQGINQTGRIAVQSSVPSMSNDGYYAVIAYNATTNICVEETGYGAVVNITVKVPDDAAGTYGMSLRNVIISMGDGTKYVLGDVNATITIPSPQTVLCTSIALDNTSAVMNIGETMQLAATVFPANAANKTVTWTSSDRSVATVSSNGLVTALSTGSATITATTTDGTNLSASCNVTVEGQTSSGNVYLDMPDVQAMAGSVVTIPINLQNDIAVRGFQFYYYYPEGFEVQSVTKTNRMTESASVASMDNDGYYGVLAVSVATNIVVEQAGYATVLNLSVKVPDNAAGTYNMSLSNIKISMADGSTYVLGDYVATITISTAPTVLCTSIALDNTSAMMNAGETMQLNATVLPADAADKSVTWTSSDNAVATVSNDGLVTAVAAGNATITATTNDGSNLSAACNVTVLAETSTNYFYIADASAFHGKTIEIPVALYNDESILAFQTDLFLPEGFTVATDENDEFMITPADRLTDSHVIMTEPVSNGSVRIVCFTPDARPILGNSGDVLFYITVNVPDNAAGDYDITLDNSRLTTANYTEMRIPSETGNIYVESYLLGDVNGSGTVTVTDIVITAQYILEMNPEPFIIEAADMNGDGEITVTDIMIIARLLLYPDANNAPMNAPMVIDNNDSMSGQGITLMPGETRTVTIALDNMLDYSAFQLDINLPTGLTASNFSLTDRAGSHALDVNTLSNGNTRALCYSPAIAAISGHEGALLTFDVTAGGYVEGEINVDGIEMVTTACQTVKLNAFGISVNSATSINEAAVGKTIASVEYFNVAGQRLSQPTNGVNIIVTTYTDGTHQVAKVNK